MKKREIFAYWLHEIAIVSNLVIYFYWVFIQEASLKDHFENNLDLWTMSLLLITVNTILLGILYNERIRSLLWFFRLVVLFFANIVIFLVLGTPRQEVWHILFVHAGFNLAGMLTTFYVVSPFLRDEEKKE